MLIVKIIFYSVNVSPSHVMMRVMTIIKPMLDAYYMLVSACTCSTKTLDAPA